MGVRLALLAGGRLGGQGADGDEEDTDTGQLDAGRPVARWGLGGKVQPAGADVEDDQVGDARLVVLRVLDELVDTLGEVALAATVAIEDFAFAYQRVGGVEAAHEVGLAGGGSWPWRR